MSRPRSILITGAASGIGAAVVRSLAAPGVALLLHTRRNQAGADAMAAEARAAGAEASVILGDLVQPSQAAAIVAQAVARHGGLDVLVSNAGFADRTRLAELTDDAMAASVEAIQGAFFRLARAAIPHLKRSSAGRIVNVGANAALKASLGMGAYAASKAGVHALTEALAEELKGDDVTVNAVLPSILDTPANRADMPKANFAAWVAPKDLAAVMLFLASEEARAVTGALIPVTGRV